MGITARPVQFAARSPRELGIPGATGLSPSQNRVCLPQRPGQSRLYGRKLTASPTRIVPGVNIWARNPPRCSKPLITVFPVTLCK
jgi:hypothetical protein